MIFNSQNNNLKDSNLKQTSEILGKIFGILKDVFIHPTLVATSAE